MHKYTCTLEHYIPKDFLKPKYLSLENLLPKENRRKQNQTKLSTVEFNVVIKKKDTDLLT